MPESRLQRSVTKLEATLAEAVITPERVGQERRFVRPHIGKGYGPGAEQGVDYPLTPSDAYHLGRALRDHGLECGYDPDTDATTHPDARDAPEA